jgi:mannose/cellobiose epimerase-like protein (N-acyl-D-glucosamine 2-epimerase family)
VAFDAGANEFTMQTVDKREYKVVLGANLYARLERNLGEPWLDCTAQVPELLKGGQMVMAYCIFYPQGDEFKVEAKVLDFPGKKLGKYRFEESNWWIKQAKAISDFFIKAQFGGPENIDYRNYRTSLELTGEHTGDYTQETDTISRLVYGFASTYMLTGEDVYLEAAEKGTEYLRKHMRFYDVDENTVYWYHGVNVKNGKEYKVFTSEFGDDYDAIPAYEQIYAMAGPTQTYRITGDPRIYKDIKMTVDLFQRFFLDKEQQGYFSHIDPVTLSPRSESLGKNKAKKSWNSVGDHIPAYLINLCLATDEPEYKSMLKYCADVITDKFQDYKNSPFVQERFFEDWSHDTQWSWQQDRGLSAHNLKIAWNLMRVIGMFPEDKYIEFSKKIAEEMSKVGVDRQRFGLYDVQERKKFAGEDFHRFAWHDRKAWWQQEQGILAFQILYGILGDESYRQSGRELAAFYNAFFLDYDDGGVYFNTLANGLPYLMGTERKKGSHSMSGYHSIELCFLAQVYTNLLHTKQPISLFFKPMVDAFPDNILRVSPDIFKEGTIKIDYVTIDGVDYKNYDAQKLWVFLPDVSHRPKIEVRIVNAQ